MTTIAPPTLSGLSHVALTVSDLSISVPWYERDLVRRLSWTRTRALPARRLRAGQQPLRTAHLLRRADHPTFRSHHEGRPRPRVLRLRGSNGTRTVGGDAGRAGRAARRCPGRRIRLRAVVQRSRRAAAGDLLPSRVLIAARTLTVTRHVRSDDTFGTPGFVAHADDNNVGPAEHHELSAGTRCPTNRCRRSIWQCTIPGVGLGVWAENAVDQLVEIVLESDGRRDVGEQTPCEGCGSVKMWY